MGKRRKRNPSNTRLYKGFHGAEPKGLRKVDLPVPNPNVPLVMIGRLEYVVYKPENPSKLAGKYYEHRLGDTGYIVLPDKPILATDAKGKNFYIIPDKSKAKFTKRGIIG